MRANFTLPNSKQVSFASSVLKHRFERERHDASLLARRAGIVPDDWQTGILRSDVKQMILNCSRQSGKSTITAVLGLHTAIYAPDALVLMLSPSLRQSQELFKKLKDIYSSITVPELPTAIEESSLRLQFSNGSRVIALPGSEQTIRGFSGVALAIIDEAAACDDALFYAIKPMLAVSAGRIILLSTPRGKRGFFHQIWAEGSSDWKRILITALDCPRISASWLEAERRAMPDFWFRQEFMCEFCETIDSVFSYDDIEGALDPSIQPLFGDISTI